MARLQNTAEGQAAGTTLTAANSGGGSGDAFNSVQGTSTFQNVPAPRSGSLRCFRADAAASYGNWTSYSAVNGSLVAARAYFYATALPTTSGLLLNVDRGSSAGARIGVLTSGLFIVQGTSGTVFTSPSGVTMPLNQWVRLELMATGGGNASSGTIRAAAYVGDSTTPLWLYERFNDANTGTGGLNIVRAGRFSGAWPTLYYDDLAAQDAATAFIGPALRYPSDKFFPFF